MVARRRIRLFNLIFRSVLIYHFINLAFRSSETNRIQVEVRQISLQDRRSIALWIDTHEQYCDFFLIVTQQFVDSGQFGKSRRTSVRAGRVTEEKQDYLPSQLS